MTPVAEPAVSGELVSLAGAEQIRVSGRAAVIIIQIAAHAAALNLIAVGRLVADFAHAKARLELTESFPASRMATDDWPSAIRPGADPTFSESAP
jgi:hypothetical protein